MKLSTLVHYKNLLEKYTPGDMLPVVKEHAGHALHLVETHEIQFPLLTHQLDDGYQRILSSFVDYKNTIVSVQNEIQKLMDTFPKVISYMNNSFPEIEQIMCWIDV